jgi:hypothetical protein
MPQFMVNPVFLFAPILSTIRCLIGPRQTSCCLLMQAFKLGLGGMETT